MCRRALLLVCCSSSHTTAWVMAVPGVRQQLQQECFALEGGCESHGAIWQLLMHGSGSQQPKVAAKPTAAAAAASRGGEVEGAQQHMLCLLRLQSSSSVQQLQRQVVALQLMVDAQTAAGSGQRLWSNVVSVLVSEPAHMHQANLFKTPPARRLYVRHIRRCTGCRQQAWVV